MNWYKIITSASLPTGDLVNSIDQTLQLSLQGELMLINKRTYSPNYRSQLSGKINYNLISPNDVLYRFSIFYSVQRKGEGIEHPWETMKREDIGEDEAWDRNKTVPNESFNNFDTEIGHRLLSLNCRVMANKPSAIEAAAQGKIFNKNIQDMEGGIFSLRDWIHLDEQRLDSPIEAAQYINSVINNFESGNFGGEDDTDNEPEPSYDPSFVSSPEKGSYV